MNDDTTKNHIQKLEIISGIRRAAKRCSHHAKPSKRLQDHIQADLPDYNVRLTVGKDSPFKNSIIVSFKDSGNVALYLSFYIVDNNKDWYGYLLSALDVADNSDYLERREQEKELENLLAKMQDEIASLIKDAQEFAYDFVKQLPEPPSTTIRKGCWALPTSELKSKFPIIFGEE